MALSGESGYTQSGGSEQPPFLVEASPDADVGADNTQAATGDSNPRLRRSTVRKGSAFAVDDKSNHHETMPRAGGTVSEKSEAPTERHSTSALISGKAARSLRKTRRNPQPAIKDHSRDELISALLQGMGRKWWTREHAIREATRRLGFARTGRQIRDAFKSAINGAIRRGLLEYDGQLIRRAR